MSVTLVHPSHAGSSDEEWQIRCDLAALYRLVARFNMTDLIYTHISARLPGPEHHFLINQYGLLFHEMRASDLVKIDMSGNLVDQPNKETRLVNPAGFTIHSAVHMARPDLKLGICGEHGGDPPSVQFFHEIGLDYVSCSPYRVPLARLAAAHAALGADGPAGTA